VGLLDRFQVAGVIASWWGDIQFDLRSLAAGGFGAVIDGWVTTITTALDDKVAKGNPLDHRLVRSLIPEYLAEIDDAEAWRAELESTIKSATGDGGAEGDETEGNSDDEEAVSPAELAAMKKELTAAKKKAKALEQKFVAKLMEARGQLSGDDAQDLVLRIARADLLGDLDAYVSRHRHLVMGALENWWDKYAVTIRTIESEFDSASASLNRFLQDLGYE
jgi:type I restriction enzyme M protein